MAAKAFLGCKDDGSDGNFSSLGYSQNGFLNANSCVSQANAATGSLTAAERQMVSDYVRGNHSSGITRGLTAAYGRIPPGSGVSVGPLVGIGTSGAGSASPDFGVGIDVTALKNFDLGNIVKIKLNRVSAFPDFIMDWVNRQAEEIVNKLTSLPTLYIILPDLTRIFESGWNGFSDKLGAKLQSGKDSYADNSNLIWHELGPRPGPWSTSKWDEFSRRIRKGDHLALVLRRVLQLGWWRRRGGLLRPARWRHAAGLPPPPF